MAVSPSPLASLGTIERTTRRELILARLRDAVSTGELAAGTHLAEIELSESLGVSRGTLREALRHLQQEGLLVSDARGRLRVRSVSEQEVREIFSVRFALEALATEEVCSAVDHTAAVEALTGCLQQMDSATEFPERVSADLAFHETLCLLSANGTLHQSWLHVSGLARAAITAAGPEAALVNMAASRHRPIIDFIQSGDADAARAFLKQHMNEAAEQIVTRMRAVQGN